MASPLSVFRKHQYWFLVGLGVLLMVAFVVLPPIDDYLRHRSATGGSSARQVVGRWKGGRITEGELSMMRTSRVVTMNFLREVIDRTVQRKGVPKGPTPRDFGGEDYSEERVVATFLMAEKAKQLGMVITDEAVQEYLDRLSDRLLTAEDYEDIYQRVVSGRLTSKMLFNWLRWELMALYLQQNMLGGVLPTTPAENWQNFLRVHQLTTVELLPLKVDDFRSQVPRQPTDEELRRLYETYRNRFPDPMSPEPGFRRLPKVNFAYVRLDGNRLLEEEKAKISEEELKAEYEAGLERGEYRRRPASSSTPSATPAGEPPKPGDSPPADTPSSDKPASLSNEQSNDQPKSPADGEKKEPQQASPGEKPDSDNNKPMKPEANERSDAAENSNRDPSAGESLESSARPSDASENSAAAAVLDTPRNPVGNGERPGVGDEFAQAEDEQPAVAGQSAPPQAAFGDSQKDAATVDAPSVAPSQASRQASPAQPEKQEPGQTPSDVPSTDSSTQTDSKEPQPPPSAPADPRGEPIPFEEVRERVAVRIADPRVRKKRDEIFDAIRRQLDTFYQEYTIWQQGIPGDTSAEPRPPDPQQWVQNFGVEYAETGLVDFHSVEKTPIAKTSAFVNFSFRPFREVAFDPEVPLYRVREISDAQDGRIEYLYWKIGSQDEYVPTLEEIRQEVVDAWQKMEARKLARQKAEQLRQEAVNKKGTLTERLPDYADKIFQPAPFSWITLSVSLGLLGMRSPQLSDVEGIEGESWQFMEAIFSTHPDELGVSANAPEDHIYVFRVVQRTPEETVLRERYLQTFHQGGMEFGPLLSAKYQDFVRTWYNDLMREMQWEWVRPPRQREQ